MLSRVSVRSYSSAPVKVVARDASGHLSTLAVKVNNAGSKAGTKSGVAHLLSKFAFLNTETKSALRFTRESELLGGSFESFVTRDAIVLKTRFLKQDLPYYVEALGNVLTKPLFRPHEFSETVVPVAKNEAAVAAADSSFVALEKLHELSFRTGYGKPLYYTGDSGATFDDVVQFSSEAYTAGNVSLHASGVVEQDLAGFLAESGFAALPAGSLSSPASKSFTGKETRIASGGKNVAVIGVPVKTADFAKYEVLAAAAGTSVLAGAPSPLAKIAGADSRLYKYEDAGLFVVSVQGSASQVAEGIKAAKKAVSAISASDLSKATKAAEVSVALQDSFEFPHNVEISADSGKGAKLDSFNYVAVGNLDVLPFADEL